MFIVWLMVLKTAETLPVTQTQMWEKKNENFPLVMKVLQSFPLGFFILEFTLRFTVCPRKTHFMFSLINVLDLVSILSIITDLAVGSNPMEINTISEYLLYLFVKIFWVCRCFRLIWFLRMSSFGLVFMYTVRKGWMDFLAVLVFLCFAALLFSIYLSASEQHSDGQHITILDALWWAFITVTTVGYGDVYASSPLSKFIAVLCALSGVLFYACFATVFFTKFTEYKTVGRYTKTKHHCRKCC